MTMSKPLSEQVATLETELAEALAENRYLEAENAALRAGQGRWPEKADDSQPRLTVHKLNVAPVGSAIYGRNLRKGSDERWWCGPYNYSAEDLIANGWADTGLRLPEGQS